MIIPGGILHDYLFNTASPNYLNFGAIGSIIGHEITHGFDTNGHTFDENGKKACTSIILYIFKLYMRSVLNIFFLYVSNIFQIQVIFATGGIIILWKNSGIRLNVLKINITVMS